MSSWHMFVNIFETFSKSSILSTSNISSDVHGWANRAEQWKHDETCLQFLIGFVITILLHFLQIYFAIHLSCFKQMGLTTGTASIIWPKWPLHLVQSIEQVSHFTPFSIVPTLKSYKVLHSSSCPRGILPCNTSTTDWLRTSWSDDIEKSITLISLLNIFLSNF